MSFYTLITTTGIQKEALAHANGSNINLTHMVFGDGNGEVYDPIVDQTELRNEVFRADLNTLFIDPNNPNCLVLEVGIPSTEGPFHIREVGVLDSDGDLFAIAKYPETFKPAFSEGTSKDLSVRMILAFSNNPAINLTVDPNIAICTETRAHEIAQEEIENNTTLALADLSNVSQETIANKNIAKTDLSNVDEEAFQIIIDGLNVVGNNYLFVASNTAEQSVKDKADYVCDGEDDQIEINQALVDAGAQKIYNVVLSDGTFNMSGNVDVKQNCHLKALKYSSTILLTVAGSTFAFGCVVKVQNYASVENLFVRNDPTNLSLRGFWGTSSKASKCVADGFQYGFYQIGRSEKGENLKAINCNYGFYSSNNLLHCEAIDCGEGFFMCKEIAFCKAQHTSNSTFERMNYGIHNCDRLTGCQVTGISFDVETGDSTNSKVNYGYFGCEECSGCRATNCTTGFYWAETATACTATNCLKGFYISDAISGCFTQRCYQGYNNVDACSGCYDEYSYHSSFYMIDRLSSCYSHVAEGDAFHRCDRLTSCRAHVAKKNGFYSCSELVCCVALKGSEDTSVAYASCSNLFYCNN